MRLVKTAGKEKRFALVFFKQFDGFRRNFPVGVLLVFTVFIGEKAHRATEAVRRSVIDDFRLKGSFVPSGRVDSVIPRCRIVEARCADVSGIAVMINLSDTRGEVTIILE